MIMRLIQFRDLMYKLSSPDEVRRKACIGSKIKRLFLRAEYMSAEGRIAHKLDKFGYVILYEDEWPIIKFPELIDRLKYLGYRVSEYPPEYSQEDLINSTLALYLYANVRKMYTISLPDRWPL